MLQYVLNQTNTLLIWIENAMKEFLLIQYLCSKGMNIFFQDCKLGKVEDGTDQQGKEYLKSKK